MASFAEVEEFPEPIKTWGFFVKSIVLTPLLHDLPKASRILPHFHHEAIQITCKAVMGQAVGLGILSLRPGVERSSDGFHALHIQLTTQPNISDIFMAAIAHAGRHSKHVWCIWQVWFVIKFTNLGFPRQGQIQGAFPTEGGHDLDKMPVTPWDFEWINGLEAYMATPSARKSRTEAGHPLGWFCETWESPLPSLNTEGSPLVSWQVHPDSNHM